MVAILCRNCVFLKISMVLQKYITNNKGYPGVVLHKLNSNSIILLNQRLLELVSFLQLELDCLRYI